MLTNFLYNPTQVSLWLIRVGASFVARVDIFPADDMIKELRALALEEGAAYIEALDVKSLQQSGQELADDVQQRVEVFGKAYAELCKFVSDEEEKIIVTKRTLGPASSGATSRGVSASRSRAPNSGSAVGGGAGAGKRSFEDDMVLSLRLRDGDEPECAWVRRENEEKWKTFERRPNSATPSQATVV